MEWGNQAGFCPQCGKAISANDFISGSHDASCKKSESSK